MSVSFWLILIVSIITCALSYLITRFLLRKLEFTPIWFWLDNPDEKNDVFVVLEKSSTGRIKHIRPCVEQDDLSKFTHIAIQRNVHFFGIKFVTFYSHVTPINEVSFK